MLFGLTFLCSESKADTWNIDRFDLPLTVQDTIPFRKDSVKLSNDFFSKKKDTAVKRDTFNFPVSADSLTAPVNYSAADSMVMDVVSKKIFLFGKSEVKYTNITLSAPFILFDQQTQNVLARMAKDTADKVIGMAKLTQAETTTVSDSILFNFKTQKGITHNSFFQQQEIYNFAERVKKIDAETFFAYRGRFTTCNLDTPHFAFRFKRAKFVNQKVAVTGPVHPEFEDVPIPIYLPFGIFPLAQGRRSGILPPQLTFTQQFGIGLEGMGYYKV
ncbi:MAG: putative LPS assembly protein LptD, partial [Sphingobacteriales bacterium]